MLEKLEQEKKLLEERMDGLMRRRPQHLASVLSFTDPEDGAAEQNGAAEQKVRAGSRVDQESELAVFRQRAVWLVGLLVAQSMSSIILQRSEQLLKDHPQIVYFLTMLVGAGGNAGNQASVRVIQDLALGRINQQNYLAHIAQEVRMAFALGLTLGLAGLVRALVFATPFPECIAIAISCFVIVTISIITGAMLPLLLERLGLGAQNASTSIQVIMDILGVVLTCAISSLLLEVEPFRTALQSVAGHAHAGIPPTSVPTPFES